MLPAAIDDLIDAISNLPGIGRKSATRMALYLNDHSHDVAPNLVQSLQNAIEKVRSCEQCGNLAEKSLCNICSDNNRNHKEIMVIETALDLLALEETGYKGLYHVLGGLISPLQGTGPSQLKLDLLFNRVDSLTSEAEIILALPTSLEGETTATYITNKLQDHRSNKLIKISKLARGLPSNSSLDYQDAKTLGEAIMNRA